MEDETRKRKLHGVCIGEQNLREEKKMKVRGNDRMHICR